MTTPVNFMTTLSEKRKAKELEGLNPFKYDINGKELIVYLNNYTIAMIFPDKYPFMNPIVEIREGFIPPIKGTTNYFRFTYESNLKKFFVIKENKYINLSLLENWSPGLSLSALITKIESELALIENSNETIEENRIRYINDDLEKLTNSGVTCNLNGNILELIDEEFNFEINLNQYPLEAPYFKIKHKNSSNVSCHLRVYSRYTVYINEKDSVVSFKQDGWVMSTQLPEIIAELKSTIRLL